MGRKVPTKNPRDYVLRTEGELITISRREKTFTIDFEIIKKISYFRAKNVWNSS